MQVWGWVRECEMLAEISPAKKKRPTKSLYNPANNGLRERTTKYSVLDYYVNVSHMVVLGCLGR